MNSNEMYASADFPDAELGRPLDFSFGEGISYSLALTNAVSKHISEVRDKTSDSVDIIWKKRFREFLVSKNEKLLEFLTVKLKNHPVLGKTEQFFQLFGANHRYFNSNTIQEIAFDLSGTESNKDIVNALCLSSEFQTINKYVEQTQYLLNLYKESVDKILKKELELSIKLEQFDSVYTNLKGLSKLTVNDSYTPMMEGVQNYLEKLFEENQFEEIYNDIIESYRRFIVLRDVIQVIRKRESVESEPLCTICFTDKVSYTFSPCGHTFCIGCVKKQLHSCSICRSSIKERVKIYFS